VDNYEHSNFEDDKVSESLFTKIARLHWKCTKLLERIRAMLFGTTILHFLISNIIQIPQTTFVHKQARYPVTHYTVCCCLPGVPLMGSISMGHRGVTLTNVICDYFADSTGNPDPKNCDSYL